MIGQRLNNLAQSMGAAVSAVLPRWFHALFLGSPAPQPLRFDAETGAIRSTRSGLIAPPELLRRDVAMTPVPPTLVAVSLPKSLLMVRNLELPGLTRQAVETAARLDLLRKTPFRPDEVHTLLSPASSQEGSYRQYVIRKIDVSELAKRLARLGLRIGPVRVEGVGSATLADLSDQWLPARKRWRRLNATLAIGIVAALAWLWLAPGLAMRREASETTARVDALRAQATDLRAQVETARAQQQEQQAFLAGIIGRPRLVEVIRDLTVALPDTVWVSDMTFDGKTAVVSGEALGSAADLVLALSKRREFTNPRLSGPVALMGSGVESFQLALDLGGAP